MNINNSDDKASILTTKIDDFFHRTLIHDVEIWTPNLWAWQLTKSHTLTRVFFSSLPIQYLKRCHGTHWFLNVTNWGTNITLNPTKWAILLYAQLSRLRNVAYFKMHSLNIWLNWNKFSAIEITNHLGKMDCMEKLLQTHESFC